MALSELLLLALTLAVIALAAAVGWLWQRSDDQAPPAPPPATPPRAVAPPTRPALPPRALRINAYGELEE